jgi:hypothetical protein
MHFRLLLVAVLIVSFARVAEAQTAAQVLKTGLILGHWAEDCSKPPSGSTWQAPSNTHVTYTASADGSGMVVTEINVRYVRTITSAQLIAPGQVRLRIGGLGVQPVEIVLHATQKSLRVWSSQRFALLLGYLDFVIREGKILSTGKDTPTLARCASR